MSSVIGNQGFLLLNIFNMLIAIMKSNGVAIDLFTAHNNPLWCVSAKCTRCLLQSSSGVSPSNLSGYSLSVAIELSNGVTLFDLSNAWLSSSHAKAAIVLPFFGVSDVQSNHQITKLSTSNQSDAHSTDRNNWAIQPLHLAISPCRRTSSRHYSNKPPIVIL